MAKANPIIRKFKRLLMAGYPLIAVSSVEEDRVTALLHELAGSLGRVKFPFNVWTETAGIVKSDATAVENTCDPVAALDHVMQEKGPALYLFKDLHPHFKGSLLVRKLRDLYYGLQGKGKFVFLLSGDVFLPVEIRREVQVVDLPLPETSELNAVLDSSAKKHLALDNFPEKWRALYLDALRGLTLDQSRHALSRVMVGKKKPGESQANALFEEKALLVRNEGVLEFIPTKIKIGDVGGLENLKAWLERRERVFRNPKASLDGKIPMPKGLLMMGISGCGKSLSAKATSALWGLPLFRLDMNQVFSGAYGSPDAVFNRAIKIMEAIAPAIMWIDEIEMGISAEGQSQVAARVFAKFLTWMQEKEKMVFVVATANRIDLLPAEMIRRGRFDQVFFVDLPNENERQEIFRVQFKRWDQDFSKFDFLALAKATKTWNGAEVEQCVMAAYANAISENRDMTQDDVYHEIYETVPLAQSMLEQIKNIRGWARYRAVPASSGTPERV